MPIRAALEILRDRWRWGWGAVAPARTGLVSRGDRNPKFEMRTPRYTGQVDALPVAQALSVTPSSVSWSAKGGFRSVSFRAIILNSRHRSCAVHGRGDRPQRLVLSGTDPAPKPGPDHTDRLFQPGGGHSDTGGDLCFRGRQAHGRAGQVRRRRRHLKDRGDPGFHRWRGGQRSARTFP